MLLAILVGLVAAIFFWGLPFIETMNQDTSTEYVTGQFTIIGDYITNTMNSQSTSGQTFNIDYPQGTLKVMPALTTHLITSTNRPGVNITAISRTTSSIVISFHNSTESLDTTLLTAYYENVDPLPLFNVSSAQKTSGDDSFPLAENISTIIQDGRLIINLREIQQQRPDLLYRYNCRHATTSIRSWTNYSTVDSVLFKGQPPAEYIFELEAYDPQSSATASYRLNYTVSFPRNNCTISGTTTDTVTLSIPSDGPATKYLIIDTGGACIAQIYDITPGAICDDIPTSKGEYAIILENNALFISQPNGSYVKIQPRIKTQGEFQLGYVHLNISAQQQRSYSGPGIVHVPFSFTHYCLLQDTYVYNAKLTLFGQYAQQWVNYYNSTCNMVKQDDQTILHPSFTQGTSSILTYTTIAVGGDHQ